MRPRLLIFGMLIFSAGATAGNAGTTAEHAVAHSVVAFVDEVNAGRQQAALAHFTRDVSIVEDLAPYHWQGPHAGTDWLEAMFRNGQKMGMTTILMHLGSPSRIDVTGDRAYEIIPGVVTLEGKSGNLRESGALTFALRKRGRAWKISALSWSGERAHR
jgi:ketosteroid isomerase-like protein